MRDPASDSRQAVTQTWGGIVPRSDGTIPALPNRWAPVRLLGEGGQAEVWLAEDLELGEPVAIKLFRADLSPAARERLRREVRLGRGLQHPGLVRTFELIEAGDRLAILMEWVPGGSLADRAQGGPLPIPEVIDTARQTLEALSALHAQQVLHRDIKPSNLLLDAEGRVKLADLGLARSLAEASDVTRTQTAVGTPAYMSPEQLAGRDPQPASDLFALGATLFELTTGQRPFAVPPDGGGDPRLTARAGSPRRHRPDCPRWLSSFILRLLEREPRDRFPDAARALAVFERRHMLVSPRLRRRLVAGGIAACFVAAAGLALWNRSRATLSSVTVSGSDVIAVDTRGRELWRRTFPGTFPEASTIDVVADDAPEVVVGLHAHTRELPEQAPNLMVLSSGGKEVGAIGSSLGTFAELFPGLAARVGATIIHPLDVDGDQRNDLVWLTTHAPWYPSIAGEWRLRQGLQPRVLLANSGTIHRIVSADLGGDGRPRLVFTGINNPLGYQLFVAVLDPLGTDLLGPGLNGGGLSPDHVARLASRPFSSSFRYNLIGTWPNQATPVSVSRKGITIRLPDRDLELDADGMPLTPSGGRSWPALRAFWDEAATTCVRIESGQDRSEQPFSTLATRNAEALAAPPIRVAGVLLIARSLARAARHQEAVRLLEQHVRNHPEALDLWLRLGEQHAILGRWSEARRAFELATMHSSSGRRPFDALVGRVLVGAAEGNRRALDEALLVQQAWEGRSERDTVVLDLSCLWAFARGDWRSEAMLAFRERSDIPAVQVLRQWGAWERGDDPRAVQARTQELTQDPETADLARLLLARLAASEGRTNEAVDLADRALSSLEQRGLESWEIFAWVPLAERVVGDALIIAGRPAEAAPHLARARRLAPGAWFGQPDLPTPTPPRAADRPT